MRIVVAGGTGQVGRMVVEELQRRAQAVVVASPSTGVDATTGKGLDAALEYADAVVDATNTPDLSGAAARRFFEDSTSHLLDAEARAGVRHHIVLSIVGADRVTDDGYFAAKGAQEDLVKAGSTGFSIVRATQFYDFARRIAEWNTKEDTVHLPSKHVQPIAASDVAGALAELALGHPLNDAFDFAGPERMALPEFVRRVLRRDHDPRYVVDDDATAPVGFNISGDLLLPREPMRVAATTLESWVHDQGRRALVGAR
ncbi:SDR family oxidoreductase [Microbacterium sp. KUDC0406]|uniref:SDR family oxidoreductase n=1 Tax=Microbacterium sp. KUDC0406 TaxID=2909588 RepID=UPI001F31BF98|nr:SDR family oxidoreductase [Microbacterium sp. KUDC0406]UJP08709.1 SDR family oxidoreductase [Microbacterium sp. KUDC0406]